VCSSDLLTVNAIFADDVDSETEINVNAMLIELM